MATPEYEGGVKSSQLPTPKLGQPGALGLEVAAGGIGKAKTIIEKAADLADNTVVSKARKAELDIAEELLSGENGFYTKRGEHAIGSANETLQLWKKRTSELMGGLHNGRQKKKLQEILERREAQLARHMNGVELQETRRFNQANHEGTMSGFMRELGGLGGDDDAFQDTLDQALDEMEKRAEVTGMTQDVLDDAMAEFGSAAVVKAATALLDDGHALQAREWFKYWERVVDPTAAKKLRSLIADEADKKIAQTFAVSLLEDAEYVTAEMDREARAEIDKIEDQDLQDKVLTRYELRKADINQTHKDGLNEVYEELADILKDNGGDMDALPATQVDRLTRNQHLNLMNYADKLRGDPASANRMTESDWAFFDANWQDLTPEQRAEQPLAMFRGRVTDGLYRQMQREQDQYARGAAAAALPDEFSYPKFDRLWKKAVEDHKIPKKRASRIYYNITGELADGRVSDQDMRDAIDAALQEVAESGWIFDDTVYRGELTQEDILSGDYYSPDKPDPEHARAVRKMLREAGEDYDKEAVRALLFQEQEGLAPAVTEMLRNIDTQRAREEKEAAEKAAEQQRIEEQAKDEALSDVAARGGNYSPELIRASEYDEIPERDLLEIERVFRAQNEGRTPTPQQALAYYKRRKRLLENKYYAERYDHGPNPMDAGSGTLKPVRASGTEK